MTYLDLHSGGLEAGVDDGQDVGGDVLARCLLEDDVDVLEERDGGLDTFGQVKHGPGGGEDVDSAKRKVEGEM